ncbi:hypothetical protein EDB85DRAFT_1891934 [Lactarius pseudohatsudake]|nr:hypothetical protein EDB85DRAFT_1891934 [Lactarius pseudohatsudake]
MHGAGANDKQQRRGSQTRAANQRGANRATPDTTRSRSHTVANKHPRRTQQDTKPRSSSMVLTSARTPHIRPAATRGVTVLPNLQYDQYAIRMAHKPASAPTITGEHDTAQGRPRATEVEVPGDELMRRGANTLPIRRIMTTRGDTLDDGSTVNHDGPDGHASNPPVRSSRFLEMRRRAREVTSTIVETLQTEEVRPSTPAATIATDAGHIPSELDYDSTEDEQTSRQERPLHTTDPMRRAERYCQTLEPLTIPDDQGEDDPIAAIDTLTGEEREELRGILSENDNPMTKGALFVVLTRIKSRRDHDSPEARRENTNPTATPPTYTTDQIRSSADAPVGCSRATATIPAVGRHDDETDGEPWGNTIYSGFAYWTYKSEDEDEDEDRRSFCGKEDGDDQGRENGFKYETEELDDPYDSKGPDEVSPWLDKYANDLAFESLCRMPRVDTLHEEEYDGRTPRVETLYVEEYDDEYRERSLRDDDLSDWKLIVPGSKFRIIDPNNLRDRTDETVHDPEVTPEQPLGPKGPNDEPVSRDIGRPNLRSHDLGMAREPNPRIANGENVAGDACRPSSRSTNLESTRIHIELIPVSQDEQQRACASSDPIQPSADASGGEKDLTVAVNDKDETWVDHLVDGTAGKSTACAADAPDPAQTPRNVDDATNGSYADEGKPSPDHVRLAADDAADVRRRSCEDPSTTGHSPMSHDPDDGPRVASGCKSIRGIAPALQRFVQWVYLGCVYESIVDTMAFHTPTSAEDERDIDPGDAGRLIAEGRPNILGNWSATTPALHQRLHPDNTHVAMVDSPATYRAPVSAHADRDFDPGDTDTLRTNGAANPVTRKRDDTRASGPMCDLACRGGPRTREVPAVHPVFLLSTLSLVSEDRGLRTLLSDRGPHSAPCLAHVLPHLVIVEADRLRGGVISLLPASSTRRLDETTAKPVLSPSVSPTPSNLADANTTDSITVEGETTTRGHGFQGNDEGYSVPIYNGLATSHRTRGIDIPRQNDRYDPQRDNDADGLDRLQRPEVDTGLDPTYTPRLRNSVRHAATTWREYGPLRADTTYRFHPRERLPTQSNANDIEFDDSAIARHGINHADTGIPGQVAMTRRDSNSPTWSQGNQGKAVAFSPLTSSGGIESANFAYRGFGRSPRRADAISDHAHALHRSTKGHETYDCPFALTSITRLEEVQPGVVGLVSRLRGETYYQLRAELVVFRRGTDCCAATVVGRPLRPVVLLLVRPWTRRCDEVYRTALERPRDPDELATRNDHPQTLRRFRPYDPASIRATTRTSRAGGQPCDCDGQVHEKRHYPQNQRCTLCSSPGHTPFDCLFPHSNCRPTSPCHVGAKQAHTNDNDGCPWPGVTSGNPQPQGPRLRPIFETRSRQSKGRLGHESKDALIDRPSTPQRSWLSIVLDHTVGKRFSPDSAINRTTPNSTAHPASSRDLMANLDRIHGNSSKTSLETPTLAESHVNTTLHPARTSQQDRRSPGPLTTDHGTLSSPRLRPLVTNPTQHPLPERPTNPVPRFRDSHLECDSIDYDTPARLGLVPEPRTTMPASLDAADRRRRGLNRQRIRAELTTNGPDLRQLARLERLETWRIVSHITDPARDLLQKRLELQQYATRRRFHGHFNIRGTPHERPPASTSHHLALLPLDHRPLFAEVPQQHYDLRTRRRYRLRLRYYQGSFGTNEPREGRVSRSRDTMPRGYPIQTQRLRVNEPRARGTTRKPVPIEMY